MSAEGRASLILGLGLGLILAGLTLTVFPPAPTPTEFEVGARALGMVYPSEVKLPEPPALPAPPPQVKEIIVVIPSRMPVDIVGQILEKGGVIGNAKEFVDKAVEMKADQDLKAGVYHFLPGEKLEVIIAALLKGGGW
ncbi:MAG: hypothetical protein ACYC6V_06965 [Bacillota bacterium]